MNHLVSGSTGPATATSTRKLWPCRRAHLCPGGTLGSRWAASKRNSCTSRTFMVNEQAAKTRGKVLEAMYIVLSKQPRKANRTKTKRYRAKLKAKDRGRRKRVYQLG